MTAPSPQVLAYQYEIDGLTLGAFDSENCWWIVRSVTGWHAPPKPKTVRVPRPMASGSYRSAAFRGERVIAINGSTRCPDVVTRSDAVDRLAAVAADPTLLYTLTVTDNATGRARTAEVEINDATQVKLVGPYRWFDWSLQLAAPDPLRYDARWQVPRVPMTSTSSPGLSFGTSGLNFAPSGLDFGVPATTGYAQVANFGNAPTHPIFEIIGPVLHPRITDLGTGHFVRYAGFLDTGDVLTINCNEFAVDGFPPRSAFLNTYTDRRVALSVPLVWPTVGPGEVHSYGLTASAPTGALLTVYLRSAWY